jgi:hypothetical protein
MTDNINVMIDTVNRSVTQEIERQIRDFLFKAKSMEWTNEFEKVIRERDNLKLELQCQIKENLTLKHDMQKISARAENMREVVLTAEKYRKTRTGRKPIGDAEKELWDATDRLHASYEPIKEKLCHK